MATRLDPLSCQSSYALPAMNAAIHGYDLGIMDVTK